MTGFIYTVSEEHNIYPNLTVYDRTFNGSPLGWKVDANEGYVFYDANANNTETNPDTMEEEPVTYYYVTIGFPPNYNWSNFALVAVPRDSVDENYIFGTGNNHEVV